MWKILSTGCTDTLNVDILHLNSTKAHICYYDYSLYKKVFIGMQSALCGNYILQSGNFCLKV